MEGGGGDRHTRESPPGHSLASFAFSKNCLSLFPMVNHHPKPNPPSSSQSPSLLHPSLLPTSSPSYLIAFHLPPLPPSSPPLLPSSLLYPLPFPPNFQIPYVTFFLGRPLYFFFIIYRNLNKSCLLSQNVKQSFRLSIAD